MSPYRDALNVGGQTIHSFSMFTWGLMNPEDVKEVWDSNKCLLLRKIDTVVVDEVSMVNANLIDAMDASLRLNGSDRRKPLGGAQVVLFGDPFQLPAVLRREDETKFMESRYRRPFFWDAKVFEKRPMAVVGQSARMCSNIEPRPRKLVLKRAIPAHGVSGG